MALTQHTISVPTGASPTNQDRTVIGAVPNVANVIGGGAGLAVVTAVAGFVDLPLNYVVQVTSNQDATAFVTAKTSTGFNVTLTPRLAANTLAAGTFDVVVIA